MAEVAESFHRHLDECSQCREQVFNLCATGMYLLQEAGKELNLDPKLRSLGQWNNVLNNSRKEF